jgi:hypothetical protein
MGPLKAFGLLGSDQGYHQSQNTTEQPKRPQEM